MPPAARITDQVQQTVPHCHNPLHPIPGGTAPIPHPGLPLQIIAGAPNVLIAGQPAARMGDQTAPCMPPGCTPGGPGIIARGSATVFIGGQPAARSGDLVNHAACVAPIPSPTSTIIGPGAPTVMIGG